MAKSWTMTDATQPRGQSQRPQQRAFLASLLASVAFALVFVMLVPLRVAECGPPDPGLLRYLGAPFFHSTGYGFASSLEARIWAGPWIANVIVIAGARSLALAPCCDAAARASQMQRCLWRSLECRLS